MSMVEMQIGTIMNDSNSVWLTSFAQKMRIGLSHAKTFSDLSPPPLATLYG